MNKKELIEKISNNTGKNKSDVKDVVEMAIDLMIDELKHGNPVRLVGFGQFEVKKRASREGRNPQTGAKITIPATVTPTFVAGKTLKDEVKGRV
ncbi:MAG: hypothetical protein DKM50_06065 [Candidatus Margulisiibacteriota bacterium]|nr:MAG: hypothetical protein A2X43_10290 [Candidatus Margulisbacteria bacterium GWD2_39_127]OGI05431.1 MAG: hypothetical protein A2X42_09220 [Candidatus Margulisbacteria bacterium GWF2_38_17]OGI07831.1 MAG: hypothetical protein A2X41_11935 [Candidatus Margulisbacteria bacterium GWE2_39_32]PZM80112.1 MAG: hypothetical protein DKM50_06065 [Candidatus Margulisiibacteriota bacterium]HAR62622.1 hypothetical protein [Candidatus Margulisiibacteriota bacterium]